MAHNDDFNEEATYHAIGRFMFEFSQLEYAIKHYVAVAAGVKEEHFHVVMTHDFALLCTIAIKVFGQSLGTERKKQLENVIKKSRRLNDERVRVAHGLWVPFMEGGTVHHVPRSSLMTTLSVDQAKHLEKEADEANEVRSQFERLMMGA